MDINFIIFAVEFAWKGNTLRNKIYQPRNTPRKVIGSIYDEIEDLGYSFKSVLSEFR